MMTGLRNARDERQVRKQGIFSSLYDDFLNDRFFSSFGKPTMHNRYSIPAANISEEETCYIIALAVPGLEKDDFNVSLENDLLVIEAEPLDLSEKDNTSTHYNRQEYNYRSFSRSFSLPKDVDKDNISASYKNGILSIRLCRIEDLATTSQSKTIDIK